MRGQREGEKERQREREREREREMVGRERGRECEREGGDWGEGGSRQRNIKQLNFFLLPKYFDM